MVKAAIYALKQMITVASFTSGYFAITESVCGHAPLQHRYIKFMGARQEGGCAAIHFVVEVTGRRT